MHAACVEVPVYCGGPGAVSDTAGVVYTGCIGDIGGQDS